MSIGMNGRDGLEPIRWQIENPDLPHGDSVKSMLGNASIDFDKLKHDTDGTYNMGEIVVENSRGPRLSLEVINNHVGGRAEKNTRVIDSYQRQRTNMAVFKALLEHFADPSEDREAVAKNAILDMNLNRIQTTDFDYFGNKYIKVAYDFLLGPDNQGENARPLSRDETRYLIDLLENGENTEEGVKKAVERLNNLRAFKAGELTDTSSVKDLVKGLKVGNGDIEKRARVVQVSVNQHAARIDRTGGDYGAAVAFVNDEDDKVKKATALGTGVLAENKEINHLILERVVTVAQKYGADLGKANSWDVAKTLLKGLKPKIDAAVMKYNGLHVAAGRQASSRDVYLAVFLQMSRALRTVLKDYGADWTEAGFKNFRDIVKKSIANKLANKPGFPAGDRTSTELATGKAIGNHARRGVDPMTRYSLEIENRSGRFKNVEANLNIREANANKSKEWFVALAHEYENRTGFSIIKNFMDWAYADMAARREGGRVEGIPSYSGKDLAKDAGYRLCDNIVKAIQKMKEARAGLEDLTPLFLDGFVDLTTDYVAEWLRKKGDATFLSDFKAAFRGKLADELHGHGLRTELMPAPEVNDNHHDEEMLKKAIQFDESGGLVYVGSKSVEDPVYSFEANKPTIESAIAKVPGLLASVMKRCRTVNREGQGWAAELARGLEKEVRASVRVWCNATGHPTDEDHFVEQCLLGATSLFTLGIASIEQLEDEQAVKQIQKTVMREINKLID